MSKRGGTCEGKACVKLEKRQKFYWKCRKIEVSAIRKKDGTTLKGKEAEIYGNRTADKGTDADSDAERGN